jgi:hypothetical protein
MEAADQTGADRRLMSYILMLGASDFMTPFGYTTNLMVYGPGGYTAKDFLWMGGPLQIVLFVTSTAVVAASGSAFPWWLSWIISALLFIIVAAVRLTNGTVLAFLSGVKDNTVTKSIS